MDTLSQPAKKQKRECLHVTTLLTVVPRDVVELCLSFLGILDLTQWFQVSTVARRLAQWYCLAYLRRVQRLFNRDYDLLYKLAFYLHTLLITESPQSLLGCMNHIHRTWGVVQLPAGLYTSLDLVGSVIDHEYLTVLVALREQRWIDPHYALDIEILYLVAMRPRPGPLLRELTNPYWQLGTERWLNGGEEPSVVAYHLMNYIFLRGHTDCLELFQPPSPWAVDWAVISLLLTDRTNHAIVRLAAGGNFEMFQVLLRWGQPFVEDKLTPAVLVACAKYGRHNILRLFRQYAYPNGCPQLDPPTMRLMLQSAMHRNHFKCVQELAHPAWGGSAGKVSEIRS